MSSAQLSYRAEIDGLRAFAVLSVVLYHAFPARLTGGFIGVDVFFVISGYLISSHIFTSLEDGHFSFADFFGRRIRRLFPALILVIFSSLMFGWLVLTAEELQQLGKHVAAGAGFVVNFVLLGESGYFDTVADTKPMLHLWSLAIEEQFYILWPLALWLAWRRGLSLIWITLICAALSFAANLLLVSSKPTEVFFWPVTRFWELLCGAALAWGMLYKGDLWDHAKQRVDRRLGRLTSAAISDNILATVGLGLLLYGFTAIHSKLPFPSGWALIPVCGAAFIIAAGDRAWTNRIFMMNPVAVWFGMISYPLYLWHWPILSFLQILEGGEAPDRSLRLMAVAASILLAWGTVRFVERPLRFGRGHARLKIASLIGAMLGLGLTGFAISRADLSATHTLDTRMIQRAGAEHVYGPSSRWFEGQDGWLYLGNQYNDTVAKLKLAEPPAPQDIARTAERFTDLARAADTVGAPVALLIGPNKSTIYPEFLPDEITPAPTRYVSAFAERLRRVPNLTVVDPTEDLRRAKEAAGLLYYRTDTHWNARGAFLAFQTMADRMGWPIPEVTFQPGPARAGDLIDISERADVPLRDGDNWQIGWARDPVLEATPLPNRPVTPFGRPEIVTNAAAPAPQTVWVIGDSFTAAVKPYIDATFAEVHYLGHLDRMLETLPDDILAAEAPP